MVSRSNDVDLFHPLSTIHWRESSFAMALDDECLHQCAILNSKIYLEVSFGRRAQSQLFTSSGDFTSWKEIPQPLPAVNGSLAIYLSQLVLVGGELPLHMEATNKVWASDDGTNWQTSLPPMPTARYHTAVVSTGTTPECLIVAGGSEVDFIGDVEVLVDGQWHRIQPLPITRTQWSGALHNGHIYFLANDKRMVLSCVMESLLDACGLSYGNREHCKELSGSLWETHTTLPQYFTYSSIHSFQNHLIVMGRNAWRMNDTVCAYSSLSKSWVCVFETSIVKHQGLQVIVHPTTGELVVAASCDVQSPSPSGSDIIKIARGLPKKVSSFNPDSLFSISSLSKLEAAGIPVLKTLETFHLTLHKILALGRPPSDPEQEEVGLLKVIELWRCGGDDGVRPATWRVLLETLRSLDLHELSQQIKDYLWSVKSLQELSSSVIMSALLQQRILDTEQLHASLPHFVPPRIKHSITAALQ